MNVERERAAEEVTKEGGYKRFRCGVFGIGALGALEYCLKRGSVPDGVWVRWVGWCVGHGGISLLIKTSDGVVRFSGGLNRNTVHRSVARIIVRLVYGSSIGNWGLEGGIVRLGLGDCGIRLLEGNWRGDGNVSVGLCGMEWNVGREKKQDNGDQGANQTRTRQKAIRFASVSGRKLRGTIDVVNVIPPGLKMRAGGRTLLFRA